jgi:heptose-I-phosphate ethanolaminephosphotransferase
MGTDLNIPISTKDISHFLMGLSGVYCDDYNPTRDFLNEKYNRNKHRIVLKSIDYDTLVF